MDRKEKIILVVILSLLLALPAGLRGEPGRGAGSGRHLASRSPVTVSGYRSGYRSYEDYIPEKRDAGKKSKKRTGKHRVKENKKKQGRRDSAKGADYKYYRVKRGDTLYGISGKFRVPVRMITNVNRLESRNSIRTGMKLKIPVSSGNREKRESEKRYDGKRERNPRAPAFRWPLNKVVRYSRDGNKGVKSIGILIEGRAGSRVISSAGGVVKKIGRMRGYGTYVVVMHKNRYITVYSKLAGVNVFKGKNLKKGDVIGHLDRNHTLHFQINQEGKSLNPLKYLNNRS